MEVKGQGHQLIIGGKMFDHETQLGINVTFAMYESSTMPLCSRRCSSPTIAASTPPSLSLTSILFINVEVEFFYFLSNTISHIIIILIRQTQYQFTLTMSFIVFFKCNWIGQCLTFVHMCIRVGYLDMFPTFTVIIFFYIVFPFDFIINYLQESNTLCTSFLY